MHLSLLSDATSSDLVDDAGTRRGRAERSVAAHQHLDGLVRGLVFSAALLTRFVLTFVPAAFGHPQGAETGIEVRP